VSLMTRKNPAGNTAGVRDRAMAAAQYAQQAAQQAQQAAQQAAPTAKNAIPIVRQGAEDAVAWARPRAEEVAAWARPHLDDARSWAAPRLERSGLAVQESIAPAISEAMLTAARKLEVKPARRRRRWASVLTTVTLLAAAASAAAAVLLRRKPVEFGYAQDGGPDEMRAQADQEGASLAEANGSQPEGESSSPEKPEKKA
jgi:hypothetical protein